MIVQLYLLDNSITVPPDGFELETLLDSPEPYLRSIEELLDPWKNQYLIARPATGGFAIVSLGADGTVGGAGHDADITSASVVMTPSVPRQSGR